MMLAPDLIFSRFFQCQPHITLGESQDQTVFNLSPEVSLNFQRKIPWFSEINRMKICSINFCLFFRVSTEIDFLQQIFCYTVQLSDKMKRRATGTCLDSTILSLRFGVIEEQRKIMWLCQGA